jgi:N-acetyl-anhydromuramyl-L-alanine amidase AmpD
MMPNFTKKNWIKLAALVLPAGILLYVAAHYLLRSDDADEGDFKLFAWLRRKPKPVDENLIMMKNHVITDITTQLTRNGNYPVRNLDKITQVVVHHSATLSTASGSNPQAYARFHVQNRGWKGIGYHYVIQPNGDIFQTNRLESVSNHVKNANTRSIGICLSGNFDEESATPEAMSALIWLIAHLNGLLNRPLDIRAHNEFASKSCPGTGFDMDALRRLVAAA